ncbi:MAG TPA: hypothetical protein VF077_12590 [Nitrospiraceae bacterium]
MSEPSDPTGLLVDKMRQAPQLALEALSRALYAEGLTIMARSQPLVPVDTGLLRSTGRVDLVPAEGLGVAVLLSYGGEGLAPYAVYVHERTGLHHPVGQDHYLSQPLYEATAGMLERLSAAVHTALEGLR